MICDLLFKLDQLSNAYGDPTGTAILKEIDGFGGLVNQIYARLGEVPTPLEFNQQYDMSGWGCTGDSGGFGIGRQFRCGSVVK